MFLGLQSILSKFLHVILGKGPASLFHMWMSSFPSTTCGKDRPFPIEGSWHPCRNSSDLHVRVYFWALCSIPLVWMSVCMPAPHCFDYGGFAVSFESRKCESSSFVLFFQHFSGYSGSEIPYKFWSVFIYSCKKHHWDFDQDCTESILPPWVMVTF